MKKYDDVHATGVNLIEFLYEGKLFNIVYISGFGFFKHKGPKKQTQEIIDNFGSNRHLITCGDGCDYIAGDSIYEAVVACELRRQYGRHMCKHQSIEVFCLDIMKEHFQFHEYK